MTQLKHGIFWKDSIQSEIDKVVVEMRKNIRWMDMPETEGLGMLWIGGGKYPPTSELDKLRSPIKPTAPQFSQPANKEEITKQMSASPPSSSQKLASIFNDQELSDLYTFGKIGVDLGLTMFTLGEDYSADHKMDKTNEAEIELLKQFIYLKQLIKFLKEDEGLPVDVVLFPFLSLIKSGKATGPIVKTALESVQHFIKHEFLDFCGSNGKQSLHNLTLAVTHCRFEAIDSISDEAVLLQILETMRLIMTFKHGYLLSNATVCEMLEAVLGMAFQRRLSNILRRASELVLVELVALVFNKLNEIYNSSGSNVIPAADNSSDDPEGNDCYGIASVRELLRVLITLTNTKDLQYTDTMRSLALRALQVAIQTAGFVISQYKDLRSCVLGDLCRNLLLITGGNNAALLSPAFTLLFEIFQTQGDLCKTQFEFFICQIVGRLMTPKTDAHVGNSKAKKMGSAVDLRKSYKLLAGSAVDENEKLINTAPATSYSQHIPINSKVPSRKQSIFEAEAEAEAKFVSHYSHISKATAPTYKSEVYIYKHCSMKYGVRGTVSEGEIRRILLESFHRILTLSPKLISNLWVNYDCDLQRGNLYDFLISFMSMKAVPWPGTRYETESAAYLDIILYYLHHLAVSNEVPYPSATWCKLMGYPSAGNPLEPQAGDPDSVLSNRPEAIGNGAKKSSLADIKMLVERRKMKSMLKRAADLFNEKPAHCLAYLQKTGYLPTENSSKMTAKLAEFLKDTPSLNKKLVGEYLSKPSSSEILQAYLGLFKFKNKRLDEAVRVLLGTFRLPGESQQIERIMEAFSSAYFASGPDEIATKDAAFILSFAIIMLNTDSHNPQVKSRMDFGDFSKNLRGVNDGQDFSVAFLSSVYQAIQDSEIVFPEEHDGEAGFEYAWKEMLVKEINFDQKNPQDSFNAETEMKNGKTSLVDGSSWFSSGGTKAYDKATFRSAWPSILQTLILTIVHCSNDHVLRLSISGIYSLLAVADRFNISSCMDEAILYFAQISGFFEEEFLADINEPVMIECADIGPLGSQKPSDLKGSHSGTKNPCLGWLRDKLVAISDSANNNLELPHTPVPLSEFYQSDSIPHWESYERSSIHLCNLSVQLGKDYCGQIALVCMFLSVREWLNNIGSSGWNTVTKVIRDLVNADLLPQKAKRVHNLLSGLSVVPRKDSLKSYTNARKKAVESSFDNYEPRKHEKSEFKGSLFGAITSFISGASAFRSPRPESEYHSHDIGSPGEDWYKVRPFSKVENTEASGKTPSFIEKPETNSVEFDIIGTPFVLLYDTLEDSSGEFGLPETNTSNLLQKLKPLYFRGESKWEEPLELLVQLVFGSRRCVEACDISSLPDLISGISDHNLSNILLSISRVLTENGAIQDDDKSFSLPDNHSFNSNTINYTESNGEIESRSHSSDNDKLLFPKSSQNIPSAKQSSADRKTPAESNKIQTKDSPANAPPQNDVHSSYEPGLLFYIELVALLCEKTPNRIYKIWNILEKPFKKMFENADSLNQFVLERLSGTLMRVAISSIVYSKSPKAQDQNLPAHDHSIAGSSNSSDTESLGQFEISFSSNEIVERVLRCIGLLRDCNKTTMEHAVDSISAGLRIIAAMDLSVLLTANNWPCVFALLRSACAQRDNCLEYPSRSVRCVLQTVFHMSHDFTSSEMDVTSPFIKSPVTSVDILDLLCMLIPSERLFSSVSGGSGSHGDNNESANNLSVKAARKKNAIKISRRILLEISQLQFHARFSLFSYTFSSMHQSGSSRGSLSMTPSAVGNYQGFQLLSNWLRSLNIISGLCYSRQREVRNEAFLALQLALNKTEWLKIIHQFKVFVPGSPPPDKNLLLKTKLPKDMDDISFPPHWVNAILQKVLFPLTDVLIRPDFLSDYTMEETHMRCLGILTNFFLNHASELLRLSENISTSISNTLMSEQDVILSHNSALSGQSSFESIWIRIVEILTRYMNIRTIIQPKSIASPAKKMNHQYPNIPNDELSAKSSTYSHPAAQSLLLAEVSQEHLKNMLLVLDSLGVFTSTQFGGEANAANGIVIEATILGDGQSIGKNGDSSRDDLWSRTWEQIEAINPKLKPLWFPDADLAASDKNVDHKPENHTNTVDTRNIDNTDTTAHISSQQDQTGQPGPE